MPAARSGFELGSGNLLPIVGLNVKDVDIVHPMDAIVTSKVDDFRVYEATGSRDSNRWLITIYDRFDPGKGLSIEVEYVVELPQLVRLATENVDLLVEGNCGMLQAADGRNTLSGDRATPLEV